MQAVRVLPLLIAALSATAVAADAPAPAAPTPAATPTATPATQSDPASIPAPTLDPATVRRAEQAADAYQKSLDAASARPDPQAEHDLAEAEIGLLEAKAFLDQNQPLKAGEQYLIATKKLSGIAPEQRAALGHRLRKATATLTELSRRLLAEQAFNLGTPPEQGDGAH